MKHIEFEDILNFREGRLGTTDAAVVERHIGECAECGSTLRRIDGFLSFAKLAEEDVPQNVTARLLNIYQPKPSTEQPKSAGLIDRIIASMQFDDWRFAPSERFDGHDSRQLLFRAGDIEIDLRFEFASGKCRVSGQLFPDVDGGTAELRGSLGEATTNLSEDSEFYFDAVATGVYSLVIASEGRIIEIPELLLVRN